MRLWRHQGVCWLKQALIAAILRVAAAMIMLMGPEAAQEAAVEYLVN